LLPSTAPTAIASTHFRISPGTLAWFGKRKGHLWSYNNRKYWSAAAMDFERITHNPAVMGGKPCIRGMRVTVGTVVGLLATGKSRERILQSYPYLVPEDIDAALAYAAWRLEERDEPLVVA
jgi:uncharacterized protein (DUF433 family)